MIQKNRSQRTALLKYSFAVPLFALMLVLSSATVNNFQVPRQPRQVPSPPTKTVVEDDKSKVYEVLEKLPSFPGGKQKLNMFLYKNIKYPAADRENNIQGKVLLQFVVNIDGSLSDIKAVRAATPAMGAEAVRVLSLSPKWIPGMQNGQKVRARYTQPVDFVIGEK